MLDLANFQRHFLNGLFLPQDTLLTEEIITTEISNEQRLNIYRNNIFATLTETLQTIYPSILQLVGENFFVAAAHQYIQDNPSTSGDLHHFGQTFSSFLAQFSPAKKLPYLSEVAELEWGYHCVYHAEGSEPLNIQRLSTLPEEHYATAQFRLRPTCRLFAFQYPVFHIWKICQENDKNNTDTVNLAEEGVKL